jgi:glycosyltransferase involved in cell wall biosynthesis
VKKRPKVLILAPAETADGGIKNYYQVLKNYFSIPVYYQYRGAREWPYRGSSFSEGIRLLKDYISYFINVILKHIQIVHINTSLGRESILRDLVYAIYAKILGKECIVFFRGWSDSAEQLMKNKYKWLLKLYLKNTDALITLSQKSQEILKSLGYKKNIYLETTLVDDNLLHSFNINKKLHKRSDVITILFLARIEKEKGIFEIIDACESLIQSGYIIKLLIAGKGRAEKVVLSRVKNKNYIKILGYVTGEVKTKAYIDSDIYVLPSYTEGMPTSVLEAMAFGLPVIITPVGGLQDIIKEGLNGYFVPIANSIALSETIIGLINDKDLMYNMSLYNYSEAQKYYASNVVKRIENIYKKVLE